MTNADALCLLPLIVTAATAVATMLAIAVVRRHAIAAWVSAVGAIAALAALPLAAEQAPRNVTTLLVVDQYGLFYTGLVLAAWLAVTALSFGYLRQAGENGDWLRSEAKVPVPIFAGARPEEFYILLALASLGSIVLVCSAHLLSFLLGLEILSVSLFALIAYRRVRGIDLEAGVKYLVLAGVSSAFEVFGAALVYAATGTMEFLPLSERFGGLLGLAGAAAILVGLGFKLAIVPFHFWTPDVYQGAPAPVAGFIATVSKGAVFALALRYFRVADLLAHAPTTWLLTGLAVASMLAGNLLALRQDNVKRMLAYSSIAHLGYLLVALLAVGEMGRAAAGMYLVAYVISSLGAFGVVGALSAANRDADRIDDYRGLAWRSPFLAAVLAAALLSLAGLPLTAGFVGKLYLALAGVGSALWLLLLVLVAGSVIGLFYYLRLLAALFAPPSPAATPAPSEPTSWPTTTALLLLTTALLFLGLYPAPLLQLIQTMTASPW
jgi:NADH-quinone oxidoreductase subunit N